MSLSIGIVGLPNVGKSTLFNALTKNNALAANYPFATIEPNTGIVNIIDERVDKLAELYKTDKKIYATIKFVDIAGLVRGAHKGEGMGNAFLSHIREVDAIAQVVRAFHDDDIQHVHDRVDPKDDIDIINTELILADIQTIDNHLPKLQKMLKGDKSAGEKIKAFEQLKKHLEQGELAITSGIDVELVRTANLLTLKPFIYVFNLDEKDIDNQAKKDELTKLAPTSDVVFVSAKIESELAQLPEEDMKEFLSEYDIKESGLERLAKVGYDTLGLQSYLTAGEKEVRAWTIPKGSTAPQAAGVIHGDFEKGFIAAEVIDYDDLIQAGSRSAARTTGKVRTEGKTYVMQPNDVVEFRFNV